MKKLKFASLILSFSLLISVFTVPVSAAAGTKTEMRSITTMELVKDMGIGINLGNTMEACGDWINKNGGVKAYETAWGSPVVTEKLIAGYAKAGFSSVRIPVAWSNLISEDYTINPDLMDRVEEIVNYVLDNGMYAIVNIHWDNGWFANFSAEYDECMKKYKSIWSQINKRFSGYGDYLIFESLNEEGCFDDLWNRYSGSTKGKADAYGILNNINQEFVTLVRKSGGNNAERHLLIAGYATDIALTCDPEFNMPQDAKNRCAVSVHYYTPPTFAILEKDASWGKSRSTWGTDEDIKELEKNMDLMKKTFVDKGIPVIIGEYGSATKNKEAESVRLYITSVCKAAYTRGMCPMLWDITDVFYNRTAYKMIDPLLEAELKAVAGVITVSFDSRGGSEVINKYLKNNEAVGALTKPVRNGYTFNGWYTAKTGGNKISSKTIITKNTAYYAQWTVAKPAVPELSVKSETENSIRLSWKKVSGATGYEIQRSTSKAKGFETVKVISKGSAVSWTDSDLESNTTYYYKIKAVNKRGTVTEESGYAGVAAKTK